MTLLLPLFTLLLLLSFSGAEISTSVGVCYGQLGEDLPPPPHSTELIKSLKAKRVKIYDADPKILDAFRNTGIQVSIMLPNDLIPNISATQAASDSWVNSNIVPFFPATKIRYLLVGNEILTNPDIGTWSNLVPAMINIRKSLKTFGMKKIKVGTSMAMEVLETTSPPSSGSFRPDSSDRVVRPMLQFLNRTKSFFFLDLYPYFYWSSQPKNVSLEYALFEARDGFYYVDPGTNLTYTNLFDQMVDAVVFAMRRLGYPDIRIWIAETGWPSAGDMDQIGANIYNAATYNRNFIKKVTSRGLGTPARPNSILPSFLFALYNENRKPGPGTERNFGLLYPNGTYVYGIDLSGETGESDYPPLPEPVNNELYKGKIWCVAEEGGNSSLLGAAVSYACSQGNGTCDPIQPGKNCFRPNSEVSQASYAFSSYWARFKKSGGTCYFDGLATQTAKDPSYDGCNFPSVTLV